MKNSKATARKAPRQCSGAHLKAVERTFREGTVVRRAESYVKRCREREDGQASFPNLAGLSRVLGIGLDEMTRLGEKYPVVYDAILAVLEDGALNADIIPGKSALLTMNYFRRRLGYEATKTAPREESGETRVVFEHDVLEDGR
ncbi:MAG: hypothetical protein J6R04_00965 [Clostridia bacterium]|nr:hypothetical protein [Clostridia bacterium]